MKKETIEKIIWSFPSDWQKNNLFTQGKDGGFYKFDTLSEVGKEKIYLCLKETEHLTLDYGSLVSEANFRWFKYAFKSINFIEFEGNLYFSVTRIKGKLRASLEACFAGDLLSEGFYNQVVEEQKDSSWNDELKEEFVKYFNVIFEDRYNLSYVELRDFFELLADRCEIRWKEYHDSVSINVCDVVDSTDEDFLDSYFKSLDRKFVVAAGQQNFFE